MAQPQEQNSETLASRLFGAAVDRIKDIPKEAFQEACHQVGAGSHEMAAALFNGNGFVMYPRGTHDDHGQAKDSQQQGQDQGQEHGQEHEQQHGRGRSM
jgi:hypothetical protein